jgi:hypothetical protein
VRPIEEGQCQSRNLSCPGRDYKSPIYQEPLWTSNFGVLGFFRKLSLSLAHTVPTFSLFLQTSAMTAQTQEELLAAHLEQQKIDVSLSISLCLYIYICIEVLD